MQRRMLAVLSWAVAAAGSSLHIARLQRIQYLLRGLLCQVGQHDFHGQGEAVEELDQRVQASRRGGIAWRCITSRMRSASREAASSSRPGRS